MAVMGLLFPAVLHYTHTELHYGKSELALSRFSSCIMLLAYACFLFFQLQSQKNLYSPVEEVGSCVHHFSLIPMLKAYSPFVDPLEAVSCYGHSFGVSKCLPFQWWFFQVGDQASTDDEVPEISKWESIVWLGIITAWISVLSEYLVDAIEVGSDTDLMFLIGKGPLLVYEIWHNLQGASSAWKMPMAFISVILLPIVGNAAEHASAVMFAVKDKLVRATNTDPFRIKL